VCHNPNAVHPLPLGFFRQAAEHRFYGRELRTFAPDVPLVPFSSFTFILCPSDDYDLDPVRNARPSIRSILLREFEMLGVPRFSRTTPISQEKEWFAAHNTAVVGTVAEHSSEKRWSFTIFARVGAGSFERKDCVGELNSRDEARRLLLDAMEAASK
jgi:hypothetical protein